MAIASLIGGRFAAAAALNAFVAWGAIVGAVCFSAFFVTLVSGAPMRTLLFASCAATDLTAVGAFEMAAVATAFAFVFAATAVSTAGLALVLIVALLAALALVEPVLTVPVAPLLTEAALVLDASFAREVFFAAIPPAAFAAALFAVSPLTEADLTEAADRDLLEADFASADFVTADFAFAARLAFALAALTAAADFVVRTRGAVARDAAVDFVPPLPALLRAPPEAGVLRLFAVFLLDGIRGLLLFCPALETGPLSLTETHRKAHHAMRTSDLGKRKLGAQRTHGRKARLRSDD